MMAKVVGISTSSVQRIWRTLGLQPHRVRQLKLSNDTKLPTTSMLPRLPGPRPRSIYQNASPVVSHINVSGY